MPSLVPGTESSASFDEATFVVIEPTRAEVDPIGHRRRRRSLEIALGISAPLALLAAWEVSSRSGWIEPRFFPAPSRVWATGVELARDGMLWSNLWASLRRTLIGFAVGCAAGIAAGVGLAMSRIVRNGLQPLIYALWTVPKLALLPLLLLVFGLGEMPILTLIALSCFFLVLIPTTSALVSVPTSYREATSSFGATKTQMLRHVLLPGALPQIFVALRVAAGASILVLVAAEFVQGNTGLGYMIWNSWSLFLADRMYVGIVVVALVGAAFTMLIGWIGNRLSPWSQQE